MDAVVAGHVDAFERSERTIIGVHDVDLARDRSALDTAKLITGGTLRADRLGIVVARGPFGPEVLVQPLAGRAVFPAEYHVWLPGALRSAAEFRIGRLSGSWAAPGDTDLELWLRSNGFDARSLPGTVVQGITKIRLDNAIQLHPIAHDHSSLVITLGGVPPMSRLADAFAVAEQLAPAVAASTAGGHVAAVSPVQFDVLAVAAASGQLETLLPGSTSASASDSSDPSPSQPPPPDPSQRAPGSTPATPTEAPAEPSTPAGTADERVAAIRTALTPYVGKRVHLAPISDAKVAGNVSDRIVPDLDPAEIVAFLDAGIRTTGKVGYVLTAHSLHISVTGDERVVNYDDIRSAHYSDGQLRLDTRLSGMTKPDTYQIGAQLTAALHDVLSLR